MVIDSYYEKRYTRVDERLSTQYLWKLEICRNYQDWRTWKAQNWRKRDCDLSRYYHFSAMSNFGQIYLNEALTQQTFTYSKLTIEILEKCVKTPKYQNTPRRYSGGVFIVNSEHISLLFLAFLFFSLNK